MKLMQQLSPYIAVITFTLIQFRRDLPDIRLTFTQIISRINIRKAFLHSVMILLPYLLFCFTTMYLIFSQKSIEVTYHSVKTVSTDNCIVNMEGRTQADVFSNVEHFCIKIDGDFFGPELRKIKHKYRKHNPKVYAVVSEDSRPASRNVQFVQVNEYDTLNDIGHYSVKAYLGGIGVDSAKLNEIFIFRIYIPENQERVLPSYAVYDQKTNLPKPLYLSEPYYIRIRR